MVRKFKKFHLWGLLLYYLNELIQRKHLRMRTLGYAFMPVTKIPHASLFFFSDVIIKASFYLYPNSASPLKGCTSFYKEKNLPVGPAE